MKTYKKAFEKPDERRDFKARGHLDIVNFDDGTTMGRAVFEPGWKWSNDVKPIAGTESCEAEHTGYCTKGKMTIRMNSGEEFQIKPGDAFRIPPGHDAWVDENESCEILDFTGYAEYAKSKESKAA